MRYTGKHIDKKEMIRMDQKDQKLRQVTDNIHGSIYLSNLEMDLISTPFFYRLHDVYQSSTVYMTFPSNRTKRYEHSLGTMDLASRIFYACLTNTETAIKEAFLEKLYIQFKKIARALVKETRIEHVFYLSDHHAAQKIEKCQRLISKISNRKEFEDELEEMLCNSVTKGAVEDLALNHYKVSFSDIGSNGGLTDNSKKSKAYLFVYQCTLEAVRIAALFHDVGHPPYSHIIEEVLNDLYKEVQNHRDFYNADRIENFLESLTPLKGETTRDNYYQLLDSGYSGKPTKSYIDSALHERFGLKLLQLSTEHVFSNQLNWISQDHNIPGDERFIKQLYLISIIEFAFAILTEKQFIVENKYSQLFKSIHKIVDGTLDADRLDYVARDSINSGVDWGRIPYRRMLESARLLSQEQITHLLNDVSDDVGGRILESECDHYVIGYPRKIVEDIDDTLLVRYKIFARINYHHNCVRTATAMQTAVKKLTEDYLRADHSCDEVATDGKISICSERDIAVLWSALNYTTGDRGVKVIQWNDAWLITLLYRALLQIGIDESKENQRLLQGYDNEVERKKELSIIRDNLKEILLHQKSYYSVFKRAGDIEDVVQRIVHELINDQKFQELREYEEEKLRKASLEKVPVATVHQKQATDSLRRLAVLEQANTFEALLTNIPVEAVGTQVQDAEKWIWNILYDEFKRVVTIQHPASFSSKGRKSCNENRCIGAKGVC